MSRFKTAKATRDEDRKRLDKFTQGKADKGLVRFVVYCKPEDKERIKRTVDKLYEDV